MGLSKATYGSLKSYIRLYRELQWAIQGYIGNFKELSKAIQSGRHDKNILGLTRVPHDLRFLNFS